MSGRTYLAGSTEPISGVVVKCAGLSTESGGDGSYEIRDVPGGTQTLTAEKPGCENYARSIEVSGDTRHNVYLGFSGVNLIGLVKNVIDGPIKGAKVSIHSFVDYTGISGRYQFVNIPRGTVTLRIVHPNYFAVDSMLSLDDSEKQCDIALKRDTTIQITTTSITQVDESFPNKVFGLPERLYLRGNGYDSLGHYQSGVRSYIYIKFDFPDIFRHSSVSILEAGIELCTDGPYRSTEVQSLSVMSPWTYLITYNNQPTAGPVLYSGFIGDTTSAKYRIVVGTEGFHQLVSIYRATGQFYGVMIKGGGFYPTGFYTGAKRLNPPRITIKLRY